MSSDMVCRKKDKRLLVLLAFGVLVLLLDIPRHGLLPAVAPGQYWLEMTDEEYQLYRSNRPDGLDPVLPHLQKAVAVGLKERQAVSLVQKEKGRVILSGLTPRLSFLLGRPLPINSAEEDDLTLIPGIGPVMANRIVTYRKAHGPIASPHQLKKVPGIGPVMEQRLQDYFIFTANGEQFYSDQN